MVPFADVGPDVPLESGLDYSAASKDAAEDADDGEGEEDDLSIAQMRAFLDHADILAEAERWGAVAFGGDDGYADILPGFVADAMTSRVRGGGSAKKPTGNGVSQQPIGERGVAFCRFDTILYDAFCSVHLQARVRSRAEVVQACRRQEGGPAAQGQEESGPKPAV